MSTHMWIRAPYSRDRMAYCRGQRDCWLYDCHQGLDGPWSGIAGLLREQVPELARRRPDVITTHETEILAVAPDLAAVIPVTKANLIATGDTGHRFRFHVASYSQRVAHGIAELIIAWAQTQATPPAVFFDNVDQADPAVSGTLEILLRRGDPRCLMVLVGASGHLPDGIAGRTVVTDVPPTTAQTLSEELTRTALPALWQEWIAAVASWRGEWEPLTALTPAGPAPDTGDLRAGLQVLCADQSARAALAQRFVDTDGTGDEPALRMAYGEADDARKARWHDRRLDAITAGYPHQAMLAAAAYHAERGTSPRRAIAALEAAMWHSTTNACYHAVAQYAERGRSLTRVPDDADRWREFTRVKAAALALTDDPNDAAALYDEIRHADPGPRFQLAAAYGTAMLLTKHLPKPRQDHQAARIWLEKAVSYAEELQDPHERSLFRALTRNGLGLAVAHAGDYRAGLDLLGEAIRIRERELPAEGHELLGVMLRHNQSYAHLALRNRAQAIQALSDVISRDPNYVDYHFELAGIYQQAGMLPEALASYDAAARLGPPYPELYYNRAIAHLNAGNDDAAIADLDYVLELDPDNLDALINRASLRYQAGTLPSAMADIEHGLRISPGNAHLTCIRGLIESETEDPRAEQSLTDALDADPSLAEAWVNRAILRFERGDTSSAVGDLRRALELADDPGIRTNLGIALHADGKPADAVSEYTRSLAQAGLDPDSEAELYFLRGSAYRALGAGQEARANFRHHLSYGPSEHHDELAQWVPELLTAPPPAALAEVTAVH